MFHSHTPKIDIFSQLQPSSAQQQQEEAFTFLEKMFCREKQSVAARALINPETSKDSSVTVASSTPPMMGMSDTYTYNHTEAEDTVRRENTNMTSVDYI